MTRLDACTIASPSDDAPEGVVVMLGGELDAAVGDEIAVDYHSGRDAWSWTWRGSTLRDRSGRLLAARSEGVLPPAEVFDVDGLSLSRLDCPETPSYCSSTMYSASLDVAVGDERISLSNGQRAVLPHAKGSWELAVARAVEVEHAQCGTHSDYVHADFAILALPSP